MINLVIINCFICCFDKGSLLKKDVFQHLPLLSDTKVVVYF